MYTDGDPDRHQNLIICSLTHCHPSLKIKIHANPFESFCAKLLIDKETNDDENNLLGGGQLAVIALAQDHVRYWRYHVKGQFFTELRIGLRACGLVLRRSG